MTAIKEDPDKKWRRVDVAMMDEITKSKVVVKLWNEMTDYPVCSGSNLKIENVVTDVFRNQVSLNSSDQTVITVNIYILIIIFVIFLL